MPPEEGSTEVAEPRDVHEEYRNAVSELHEAADAVEEAAQAVDEADPEDEETDQEALQASLNEAEESFTASETRANELRDRVELFDRTREAREVTIPDEGETSARVTNEPLTYERGNGNSFMRDAFWAEARNDQGAAARLQAHRQEMEVERPEQFDLSSTDSAGGYLVAPLYLQDEFAALARAGRPVVDALGPRPLPPNTDSINIPRLATGTSTADQGDNAAVSETDATFGTVAADVKTIAGMQDVSQQLVDRSVPGVDEVIFGDLAGDYGVRLDTAVINSSTANNEGLLQADSTNTTSYTDASPTVPEAYPKFADAIQEIHSNLFLPPDAIFMHPRRWGWFLAATDTSNRPLVVPMAQAPQNAVAVHGGVVSEGFVGQLQGVNVFVSANIPTTNGAGTNEDAVIIVRRSEQFVWEDPSGPYLDTFRDVGSGNLTVRFRLFNYWAQQHERRPVSISLITGTGLAAPTF